MARRTTTPKSSSRPTTSEPDVNLVYGITKAIVIGHGPRAQMEAAAARLNEQAPQYKHRIEEP